MLLRCCRGTDTQISQQGITLHVESSTNEDETTFIPYLRHYLDLERDVPQLLAKIDNDAYIHRTIQTLWGMHILNQELWETTVSFILSQNNNVSRIRGIIRRLSERYGEKLRIAEYVDYSFPRPHALATATEKELRVWHWLSSQLPSGYCAVQSLVVNLHSPH